MVLSSLIRRSYFQQNGAEAEGPGFAGPGKRSVYSQDTYKLMIMTAALSRGNNVIRL